MKLIVGLGNIGKEYNYTPHNAGFLCLDMLKETLGDETPWYEDGPFEAFTSKINYNGEELILLKPTTFMNKSGDAVFKYMEKKDIKIEDLILIHDDLDIQFGKYKFANAKSPKKHNGVNSVERRLKSIDFQRVRIGVDNRNGVEIPGDRYVLKRFGDTEVNILRNLCVEISNDILKMLSSK